MDQTTTYTYNNISWTTSPLIPKSLIRGVQILIAYRNNVIRELQHQEAILISLLEDTPEPSRPDNLMLISMGELEEVVRLQTLEECYECIEELMEEIDGLEDELVEWKDDVEEVVRSLE